MEKKMEILKAGESPLEKIFANNPLIGNYVFSEKDMLIIHEASKKLIRAILERGYKPSNKDKMAIALSVINYIKTRKRL